MTRGGAGALRPELQAIVETLLAESAEAREVTLDAIGNAVGARAITSVEIDAMIAVLEASGRAITGPVGGSGEDRL